MVEAWTRVKWLKNKAGNRRKFEIFEQEYEIVTEKPEVDLELGKYRKTEGSEDGKLMEKIQERYQLNKNLTIIYTDGSKKKKGISTGASIVMEEQEIVYNMSMTKKCSTFTAEAFAIRTELKIIYNDVNNKNRQ